MKMYIHIPIRLRTVHPISSLKKLLLGLFLAICSLLSHQALAVVKYDEGRLTIDGIQLLQDYSDPKAYYYLPQYPRLATNKEGNFEILCMKYVGEGSEDNGGIFHALFEFSLPAEVVSALGEKLQEIVPGGKIVGPVPLQQALKDGDEGIGGFKIISSILSDGDSENPMQQSLIYSSHAPFLPGSKAAVAAKLNQHGATLLWESLTGNTSDVSVSVQGYYEAAVKGYNAIVTADVSAVYEHYSLIFNQQGQFTRRQLRDITDEMITNQQIKVEVFDRSQALDIDSKDMEAILSIVTEKLTGLLFDAESGWAREPQREVAVEDGQIKGRLRQGFLSRLFKGSKDMPYVSDDQFVLKNRKDIQARQFYLNLSKSSTIKVPVYASGNLGGIYSELGNDERYFKIVNLDDPDFQKRSVHFQVDGNFIDAFGEWVNHATVNFRKVYGEGQHDVTHEVIFKREDLENGTEMKEIVYPRLGDASSGWLDYEVQFSWSIKGQEEPIRIPYEQDSWIRSNDAAISIMPPFAKKTVEIDADRAMFADSKVKSARVKFFVVLAGKPRALRTLILRDTDTESTNQIALFHDPNQIIAYQVSWFSQEGSIVEPIAELTEDYLFLLPPDKKNFKNR